MIICLRIKILKRKSKTKHLIKKDYNAIKILINKILRINSKLKMVNH